MAELYLGLISGTSADAVDAALVDFRPAPHIIAADTFPLPAQAREALLAQDRRLHPADLLELDALLGEAFGEAALLLLQRTGVDADAVRAIGSHGQTLWHAAQAHHPATCQIADPNRIAECTGITTVADFRRRDMAADGEGAPLAPAFHNACLRVPDETRGILNLGGIANLTVLPANPDMSVTGFDTGPANTLMDAWCRANRAQRFDEGGRWAAGGQCDEALLSRLLDEPYFHRPPPKSTGPEQFNLDWVRRQGGGIENTPADDLQATLLELTARSVAAAVTGSDPPIQRVLACGGGVHNAVLMERLQALLPAVTVESTGDYGVDPDFVEAATFAWLARETLAGRPGNLPTVTGARGPRILGAIHPGR